VGGKITGPVFECLSEPSLPGDAANPMPLTARCLFIIPGRLDRLTGGSIYDKRLNDYLRKGGASVDIISLPDLHYFAGLIAGLIISPLLALRLAGRAYDLIIEDGWAHPSLLLFNLLVRVRPGLKVVTIVHQLRWVERRNRVAVSIARLVERSALKSSRLIFTVSHFMRRRVGELIGDDPRVIVASPGSNRPRERAPRESIPREFPITDSATPSRGRGAVHLLFIGNCARRKGLHRLVGALSILRDPLVKLDVVGDYAFDPAYAEELRCEVARLDLDEAVKFHGRVSDEALSRFYARADVFVMPSSYEGFGIVYAEAMRAGLPIIACDTGPAAEIVSAGENALLVPGDSADALADAIRTLASDGELRARFSRRSLELSRRLPTWDDTCGLISRALSGLVREQKTRE
jgi:glycosyltransferase involved in cell wall biosynthesis